MRNTRNILYIALVLLFSTLGCVSLLEQTFALEAGDPIHLAALNGDLGKVKELTSQDQALIEKEDKYGRTPFHYAAMQNRTEVMEYLLQEGARIDATSSVEWCYTPLFCAVNSGKTESVRFLLENGADPSVRNQDGVPPYNMTCNGDDCDEVYRLIKDKIISSKSWSKEMKQLIKDGKIKIGMTQEMVLLSWGQPKDVNKMVGEWGVHEQWVYGTNYLYFENGVLSSYQN